MKSIIPDHLWISFVSIQITAASISFIASLAVAVSVGTVSIRKKSSPYKRIILCVSVADIIQSLSLIIGPFTPPASIAAIWSKGNQATCTLDGFLFSFGGCLFVMSTAFLCFYYLCKIKRRMTDATFNKRYEWETYTFIIVLSLAVNLAGVAFRTINTGVAGTQCANGVAYPTGCRMIPGLECEEPISRRAANMFTVIFIIICASFIGIVVCMGSILWHVTKRNPAPQQDTRRNDAEARIEMLRCLFVKEITTQSLLFTCAFFVCNGTYVIANVILISEISVSKRTGAVIVLINAIFYPLNGLFTILIHTRPEIGRVRRGSPEFSWMRAFVMVLKSGGEKVSIEAKDVQDNDSPITQKNNKEEITSLPYGIANMTIETGNEAHKGSEIDISKNSVRFRSDAKWSHLEGVFRNTEDEANLSFGPWASGMALNGEDFSLDDDDTWNDMGH